MTRKKKVKEADVTVSIKPDRSGVNLDYKKAVKELEPVNDEEPTTVKQSYVAPETILVVNNRQEDTPILKDAPDSDVWEDLQFAVAELPSPLFMPTQRQYGEEFLPEYTRVRNKLRRLAGLLNGMP